MTNSHRPALILIVQDFLSNKIEVAEWPNGLETFSPHPQLISSCIAWVVGDEGGVGLSLGVSPLRRIKKLQQSEIIF